MRTISARRSMIDGEAAADFRLNSHRHDQKAQVIVGHALEHLFHCARQRKAEPRLLDDRSEFGRYRIFEFSDHHLQPAQQRMPRLERGLHEVECEGKLLNETS